MKPTENQQSYDVYLDNDFPLTREYVTEILTGESRVAGKKSPPAILTRIAWIFRNRWRTAFLLFILDVLGAAGGVILSCIVGKTLIHASGTTFNNYFTPIIIYVLFILVVFYFNNSYGRLRDRRSEQELRSIVIGCSWGMFLVITLNFILFKNIVFSRYIIILGFLFSLSMIIFFRFGLRELLKHLWSFGLVQENVVIVGDAAKDIRWLLEHLHIQNHCGFNILGYFSQKPSRDLYNGLKYLGKYETLAEISRKQRIDKVFFAMLGYSDHRHTTLLSRLEECAGLKISAMVISHIFNDFNFSLTLDGYSNIFILDRKKPAYCRPFYSFVKRSMDIIGSLLILLCSLPIWLIAIICIKIQDGGPIFFKHELVGKDGKFFHALKFRTMVLNAQEVLKNTPELWKEFSENYKLVNDPRVTWIGKWLRRSSMDELPQVINIIKGDMSLVGPRPVKVKELERYGEFKHERVKVRPGLTGFWQVSGRCNTSYEERIQMDKFYINKSSIWMDLVIILKPH